MHDRKNDTFPRSADEALPPVGALDADLVAPTLLHELKQPLMAADASAQLLERTLGSALARDEEWRILRAQLERLAEIVVEYEELLGPGDGEPARYTVGPVVSRAVALLAHRVRPLARRFSLARDDGDRQGFGAPGALVHAATNVLANALDAIEGVGGDPRVQVRVLPGADGGVEVRVSDEGVGIPADMRARLFEPRFTTKGPGRGSGLGLHLARRLMARHGGEVFLVGERDPERLPWAVTEFCIAVAAPPAGGRP
jgi:signal transduction histidine kinase